MPETTGSPSQASKTSLSPCSLPRRRVWTHLGVLGAATLSSCGLLPPLGLKAPQFSVSDFRVVDIGLSQVRFAVTVAVFNPNAVVLPISSLVVDVEVLERPLGQGTARESLLELAAQRSTDVPIDFVVPTARVRELFRALRSADTSRFGYVVRGSARWGADGITLPFRRDGELQGLRRLSELLQR